MTPEARSIARLRATSFQIDEDQIATLEEFFRQLRSTDQLAAGASPHELYEAQWAILGIVSRSYQLMLCCIDQIADGNWNGFYAAARGLVETLFSIVWVSAIPERLVELVRTQEPSFGKMKNAGCRRYSELKETYGRLSSIVHPYRESHVLGFRPVEQREELGAWSPFTLTFSDYFAVRKVTLLVQVSESINQELSNLLVHNNVLVKQGRVMARVAINEQDSN